MIHNLYIIKANGICVFHKKYGSLEEEPQSISGFLTAISQFSQSIIGEPIKTITTNNYKFVFKPSKTFSFVVFVDKSDNELTLQESLEDIEKLFNQQFTKGASEPDGGNTSKYEEFNSPLTTIINSFH